MVQVALPEPLKGMKLCDVGTSLPRSMLYSLRTVGTAPPRFSGGEPLPIAVDDIREVVPIIDFPLVIVLAPLVETCLPAFPNLGLKDFRINTGVKNGDMMTAHL